MSRRSHQAERCYARRDPRKSYETLRAEHIKDHQALFRRVSIDLGSTAAAKLPTDERIADSPRQRSALVALLFQYGRYLMIAPAVPAASPPLCRGLWNDSNKPAWIASTPTTSTPK